MIATLLPTVPTTRTPTASSVLSQPNSGLIITPESLWVTSQNPHIRHNAPALLHLLKVTESDPRHSGLFADLASIGRLRREFEAVAETFEQPFHTICHNYFTAPNEDPRSVQNRILKTLCGLSKQHPEIPGILWCVLGHIGTRQDPYELRSLLKDDDYAFGCAKVNDAALHAMCMVTPLKTLIDQHEHFYFYLSYIMLRCDHRRCLI